MASTSRFHLPYPVLAVDAPNVPLDLQKLAAAIEVAIAGGDPVFASTAPTPTLGRIWVNITTRDVSIANGTSWSLLGSTSRLQVETVVVNTNSGGNIAVAFPVAFSGSPVVVPSCGGTDIVAVVLNALPTASAFTAQCYKLSPTGTLVPAVGQLARINYTARGPA